MGFNNIGVVGTIALGIGAIAWFTNPGEQKYQQYADATIKTELKDKVCVQVAEDMGVWLEGQCHLLINAASPYLVDIVNQQTERRNFLLFSIYQADLPLPTPLPDYQLETIGILGNFFIYRTEKL
jgi:hypothetical protein